MPKKIVSDFGDKKFYLICQDGRAQEWRQNKEGTDLIDVVLGKLNMYNRQYG